MLKDKEYYVEYTQIDYGWLSNRSPLVRRPARTMYSPVLPSTDACAGFIKRVRAQEKGHARDFRIRMGRPPVQPDVV